ncbi:MAG TPA: autotransporter-associated beta strand repeat-containing protein, partial [Pirellulales bacterium]
SNTSLGIGGTATINAGTLEATASINSSRNFALGSSTSTILVDSGLTYTISGVIADGASAGTLNATGAGTLVLTGTNSYSGGTSISAGTLIISSDSNLGNPSGNITMSGFSTLEANGTFSTNRSLTSTAGFSTIDVPGSNVFTMNGVVNVTSGFFNKTDSGTLVLTNANNATSFNSFVNIDNGTIQAGVANALGNLSTLALGNNTTSGVFDINGFNQHMQPFGSISTSGTGTANAITNSSATAATFELDLSRGSNTTYTYSGLLTGNLSFQLDGATGNTQILTGANTYTGNTIVTSGTLAIGVADDRLPTGTTLVLGSATGNPSGTFDLAGFNQTVAGLTTAGSGTSNQVVNSGAGTPNLTVSVASGTDTFSGLLGGTGSQNSFALVKQSAGTLALTGDNTYTGGTTINGGTVQIDNINSLGASGTTATINAATLEAAATFTDSRSINLNNAAAAIMVDASQTYTLSGVLSGTGGLNVPGP